ncbi:xylose isomerase [Bemisia tabaci]|uniref:xylose isomerase n=1 Tax=Bemisia tabaci TaxID=7038 RepID=UPI003B28964B
MAAYSSVNNAAKRQKPAPAVREITPARSSGTSFEFQEFLPDVSRSEYRPELDVDQSTNFKYYNASEKVHGRSLEEWIRPAISFYHVINEYHSRGPRARRIFEDSTQNSLDGYKRRIRCVFELGQKLGIKLYTAADSDFAPFGESLEDFHRGLDENINLVLELQQKTGITPLWIKPNFETHLRGSELQEVIHRGAQIKKALEIAQKLGAENFLLDEIETLELFSVTDFSKNFRQHARLLKLTAEFREHVGYRGQLLLLPNYSSQSEIPHQDTAFVSSALAFLKNYNLDRLYKLCVRSGYDFKVSLAYNLFGSLEVTKGRLPPELREATLLMKTLIEHGGFQTGGLNIGLKSNPESDLKDVFVGYITALDVYAKALRVAAKLTVDGIFTNGLQQRYSGFQTNFGARFMNGELSLEDLSEQAKRTTAESPLPHGPNFWAAFYSRNSLNL